MKKKFLVIMMVFVMSFSVIAVAGCDGGDPNRGSIEGLEDGYFVAHHGRGIVFREGGGGWFSVNRHEARLISSRGELIEWARPFLETMREWNSDTQEWETIHIDLYDNDIFAEFCEEFFELRQLVFICFDASILDYEVERISYQNNRLSINFVSVRSRSGVLGVLVSRLAIVEITRICDNLYVEFSSRRQR